MTTTPTPPTKSFQEYLVSKLLCQTDAAEQHYGSFMTNAQGLKIRLKEAF